VTNPTSWQDSQHWTPPAVSAVTGINTRTDVVLEQKVEDFKICVSFIDLYDAETWDTLESGSEIPGKL